MENRKYCVYNQTRESFLSLGVVVADSALKQLKVLIENLAVKADQGLWLTPYRGIPPSKNISPVDIIHLDEDNQVIQAIESFPNSTVEPVRTPPASALVLPPHTVFSSQTHAGDKLVICLAEEMEHLLEQFSDSSTSASVIPIFQSPKEQVPERFEEPSPIPFTSSNSGSSPTLVPSPSLVTSPRYSASGSHVAMPAREEAPSHHPIADADAEDRNSELLIARQRLEEKENAELEIEKNRTVFTRFLRWISTDRRSSKRQPLPGLVAYYWTGGYPQAYHIGDISNSGMYLLTDERWYPGTMILMTLQRTNTDGDDPEDFISIQTKVTRWGNDGVGLSFVPSNAVDLNSGEILPETGVGKKTLLRFVERVQRSTE